MNQTTSLPSWAKPLKAATSSRISSPALGRFVLVAMPGTGKTTFMATHPSCLHLNLDGGQNVPHPQPAMITWPDQDTTLTWSKVQEIEASLLLLAHNKEPRPQTVFVDSLTSLLALLREHAVKNATSLGLAAEEKKEWRLLDGRRAWDYVYDEMTRFLGSLHRAGYGVWVAAHVVNQDVRLDAETTINKPGLTVTDNCWKRLFGSQDGVLFLSRETITETQEHKGPSSVVGGVTVPGKSTWSTVRRPRYSVMPYHVHLTGILKTRVPIGDQIVLPSLPVEHKGGIVWMPGDGWGTFAQAYEEAAQLLSNHSAQSGDRNAD